MSHVTRSVLWKLGIGYYFFDKKLEQRKSLNHLLLELNAYYTSGAITGNVWQYQLPLFNNYSFRAPFSSARLMMDLKPSLFTTRDISPYPIVGIGAAWNTIFYQETVTGAGVDPSSALSFTNSTKAQFAFELGAGLKVDLTKHCSTSIEYLFANIGKATPSSPSNSAALKQQTFALITQSLLLGMSWKV